MSLTKRFYHEEINADDLAQAAYEDYQAEETFKFFEKQKSICQREKQIGLTCIYCEFKQRKVDLSIPF